MKHSLQSGSRAAFALFLLLCACLSQAYALSGTVTGKVTLDGQPVAGAKVTLYLVGKPHASTTSDALGQYKIDNVWMGQYDVEASLRGLKTTQKAVMVKLTQPTLVNLALVSPPKVEPPLVKAPTPVKPLPKTVTVTGDAYGYVEEYSYDVAPVEDEMVMEVEVVEAEAEESWIGEGDFGMDSWSDDDGFDEEVVPVRATLNREGYEHIAENRIHDVVQTPVSTFAIDVDAASYTNCRRMLLQEQRLPPASAVRAEEFINYFDYDYPQPKGEHPFSITTELGECPWNPQRQLVHIGIQGRNMDMSALPASNLVFLVDVSGSMDEPNKLPLVKQGLSLLVDQLRPQDRVAIVVYAGAAGMVLPSTSGRNKPQILAALEKLSAGGSTAGGQGIQLAYKTARENFKQGGNNRVILCTDGDFNVGTSSDGELVKLIEQERTSGVFLSVLGFGGGNYQDAKMEKLADNGNGNYAYIDQVLEAKRVFVSEIGGTLNTIAKDVKIQVEFNPAKVKSYRLIGYENRALAREDFDDDKKDAGELGAGHSVTAIYEIEPASGAVAATGALRYQQQLLSPAAGTGELLTVKFRYKAPDGDVSRLIEQQCSAVAQPFAATSSTFQFSAAVAAFAMILRESDYQSQATLQDVLLIGKLNKGADSDGYRAEFLKMVEVAMLLKK